MFTFKDGLQWILEPKGLNMYVIFLSGLEGILISSIGKQKSCTICSHSTRMILVS